MKDETPTCWKGPSIQLRCEGGEAKGTKHTCLIPIGHVRISFQIKPPEKQQNEQGSRKTLTNRKIQLWTIHYSAPSRSDQYINTNSWHNRKQICVDWLRLWLAGLLLGPGVFLVGIAMETSWGSSHLQQREGIGDQLINPPSFQSITYLFYCGDHKGRQLQQVSIVLLVLFWLVLELIFVSVLLQIQVLVLELVLVQVLLLVLALTLVHNWDGRASTERCQSAKVSKTVFIHQFIDLSI